MGLRDLFKRHAAQPPADPKLAVPRGPSLPKLPQRASDAAAVPEARRPALAKRPPAVRMVTVGGQRRPAPQTYQPRQPGQLHHSVKPPDQWGIVDLFDYWLDLNEGLPDDLARLRTLPPYERPRMDLDFETAWPALTDRCGLRPADVALLMRWSLASGEMEHEFLRRGVLGFLDLVALFAERTEQPAGAPVRCFRDPGAEASHALIHWQLSNLDRLVGLFARTYGFPAIVEAVRGINPKLGPSLIKHACRAVVFEKHHVAEIALMRQLHGETVRDCPPDEWFMEK